MDTKKEDWKKDKSVNNDMSSCGCGSGTGYAANEGMSSSAGSASSMKDKSSDQFNNTGYQSGQQSQPQSSGVSGKSCKADSDMDMNMNASDDLDDIYVIETRTDIYQLSDDAFGDNQDKDLNRKLNQNSEDLTDM